MSALFGAVCFVYNPTDSTRSGVCGDTTGACPKNHKVILQYDFSIPDRQFHGGFLYPKKQKGIENEAFNFMYGDNIVVHNGKRRNV